MSFTHLPEEQARRAEQLFESLKASAEHDLRAMAELLASKSDEQLFGSTEFQLRDLVHRLGAGALQTAVEQRKKGGTEVPA
jgi:CHAD domain-containing protein